MTEQRPLILVIEDDDDIRTTVVDMFRFEGYGAIGAADGKEALRLLQASDPKPALILLDLMMPFMNGAEFREQQLADPSLAHIPVVVLSADANAQAQCAELGAAGFVKKPMKLGTLLATVQRLAGGG